MFPNAAEIPKHLAYVHWFSKFQASPDPNFLMYKVTRLEEGEESVSSIIPVSQIVRSVHLFPKFGSVVPLDWTSDNVLEKCQTFYVNSFKDRSTHFSLY